MAAQFHPLKSIDLSQSERVNAFYILNYEKAPVTHHHIRNLDV